MVNAVVADIERRLHASPAAAPGTGDLHLELAQNTDSLDRLVGCNFYSLHLPTRSPGWTYKNPSIAINPAGGYYCAVRYSSWPVVKYFATHSEVVIVSLSDRMEVTECRHVAPLSRETRSRRYSTFGPEDMRLFRAHGRWFGTASFLDAPECVVDGAFWTRMGLLSFDDTFQWTSLAILPGRVSQHEKNWMPIEGGLDWLYTPHNTLRCTIVPGTTKLAYYAPQTTPRELRFSRGSTQIVNINADYALGVVHDTVTCVPDAQSRQHGYHRAYMHRFVLYRRQPFCVAAVSPPFHFLTQCSVEFAAGLAYTAGKLFVSFGHHDLTSWIAQVRLADVLKVMRAV
jgi:hypothetical protein